MIRVLTPDMPPAVDLIPWLDRMERERVYVNGGQLHGELTDAVSRLVRAPVAVVSNGTLALELALRALRLPPGAEVMVPAVTFIASAQAIVNAGLRPLICDVDPSTWQLHAEAAAVIIAQRPSVFAVMPVAAFGAPVGVQGWARLSAERGVAVVIDAAGAMLQQQIPDETGVSVAFSMHATKAVGAGEGGAVASANTAIVARVAELARFGRGGTNAKMSEYHAAVGLASLDRVAHKARKAFALEALYALHLPTSLQLQAGPAQRCRTLLPVLVPAHTTGAEVAAELKVAGIETRQWYRPFLDERIEFLGHCLADLPVTQRLRSQLLGLPFHSFMTEADVIAVCNAITRAVTH